MPDIIFEQSGLPAGVLNRQRTDIVIGTDVDITASNVLVGDVEFAALDRPPGASATITGTGLTRQLNPDVAGGYRIRVRDTSLPSTDPDRDVVHTFNVKTPLGLVLAAANERADPDANEFDTDPGSWVDDSESNEGGTFKGWATQQNENLGVLEAADAVAIHDNRAAEIFDIAVKTSTVLADVFLMEDSAAGFAKKKIEVRHMPGGSPTLQLAYNGGNAVAVNGTAGTFLLAGNADATTALTVSRAFVGPGDAVAVQMGLGSQAVTGDGISVVTGANATGRGLFVNYNGTGQAVSIRKNNTAMFVVDAGADTVSLIVPSGGFIGLTGGQISLDATDAELKLDDVGSWGGTLSQTDDRVLKHTAAGEVFEGITSLIGALNAAADNSTGGASTPAGIWRFSTTTTDEDPGNGRFRLNNATQANSTQVFLDDQTWDSSTNLRNLLLLMGVGDRLYIQDKGDNTKFHVADVTSAAVAETGYVKVPISITASGASALTNNSNCLVLLLFGASDAAEFNSGEVSGLHIANDGTTPDEIVDIDAGSCRDSTDTFNIVSSGTLSPDNTASGAGGLDTGTVASDTLYAVHVIGDTTGANATSSLFSLSGTAPTMPGTHDKFRRIGWVKTDATSDFETFFQPKAESRQRWTYFKRETEIQATGTAASFTATATSAATFIPDTAIRQQLSVKATKLGESSSAARVEVVPDGWDETAGAKFWVTWCGLTDPEDILVNNTFEMPVGPSQLVRYRVQDSGDANATVSIDGYEDAL